MVSWGSRRSGRRRDPLRISRALRKASYHYRSGVSGESGKSEYIPDGEELYPEPDYVDRVVETFPVRYQEGLFLGYRHYLRAQTEPLFWFGHGLTYTTFDYSELSVEATSDGGATVRCRLANTGTRRGAETLQVYLSSPNADTPTRLAGFAKHSLDASESAVVEVQLQAREFERFDEAAGAFVRVPGEYGVLVGASAGDIRVKATVTVSS